VTYSRTWAHSQLTDAAFLLVAGPTSAGKTILAQFVSRAYPNSKIVVVHTDRQQRRPPMHSEKEIEGFHYYFVRTEWFDDQIKADSLVAHIGRYGNRYGLAVSEVQECLDARLLPVLVCNVDTALQIKRHYPRSSSFFVCSRDLEAVRTRARGRDDNPENTVARLALVDEEVSSRAYFDYVFEYDEDWAPGTRYLVSINPSRA
jgi:guanylate kinase